MVYSHNHCLIQHITYTADPVGSTGNLSRNSEVPELEINMFSTLRQTFGDGDRLLSVEIAPPFDKDRTSMRTACERCRAQKVGHIAAIHIHHHYPVGES